MNIVSPNHQSCRNTKSHMRMDWESYYNKKNLTIPCIFVAAIILVYYREELTSTVTLFNYTQTYPYSIHSSPQSWVHKLQRDDLQIALRKASTAKKTVMIVIINEAYVEPHENEYPSMFDIFLEGFWVGDGTRRLLRHLLVVSMDKRAHERCEFRHLNCYLLAEEDGGGGEKVFMSEEFIQMMWRRTGFLLRVLKNGYNFIFTDCDVIWLRDPFPRLTKNDKFDLQISTDYFNGDALSENNPINTGFYSIRSNSKTTSLFEKWYEMRTNTRGMKEQDVLQMLIREKGALREFNITATFLDTQYFSGFCSDSKNVGSVITVHANCCRTIKAKIVDLKTVLMDWKKSSSRNDNFRWSPHKACANSWNRSLML